jgi:hypothetical protein
MSFQLETCNGNDNDNTEILRCAQNDLSGWIGVGVTCVYPRAVLVFDGVVAG